MELNMQKSIMIIGTLTTLFIGLFVLMSLTAGEESGPHIWATATCPGGTAVPVYVPVDCMEVCPTDVEPQWALGN